MPWVSLAYRPFLLACLLVASSAQPLVSTPLTARPDAEESPRQDEVKVENSATFRLVEERAVPGDLPMPRDVRWGRGDTLLLATGRGLVEIELTKPDASPRTLISKGNGADELPFVSHAAHSEGLVAAAALVQALAWKPMQSESPVRVKAFAAVVDMDLSGDRALLLGGRRGPEGQWCPDGAIAWTAKLDETLEALTPIFYSSVERAGTTMGRCGIFKLGAVRFLAHGGFVVIPGVEGGVHLYDPDGTLSFAWTAEEVGFFSGCPLDEEEQLEYSMDPKARAGWLNQRPVVEEILPIGDTFGVVIRRLIENQVRWELVHLQRGGTMQRYPLPFTTELPFTRLRGDARGGDLLFLLYQALDWMDEEPALARLLLVETPWSRPRARPEAVRDAPKAAEDISIPGSTP